MLIFYCIHYNIYSHYQLQVSSLSNQLEKTRAQLQLVEKQLHDEQQIRESIEQKLVEHDLAGEEKLKILKSQLDQFQIEQDSFVPSSRIKHELFLGKDEQMEQLKRELNELQRHKVELEGELHDLQQEMKKQLQERGRFEAVQLERQKEMEEEMQMEYLAFKEEASRAHSAEVNKLNIQIKELEQSLEESKHSNMASTEDTQQFHKSQLQDLQQSLERANDSCCNESKFYELQICNLKEQIEYEQSQQSVMCGSLQQELDSALMQLNQSTNSIKSLNRELTSMQSELEALDTNLRLYLAAAEGKANVIQMEVAVATDRRKASENVPVQFEYRLSKQDRCVLLPKEENHKENDLVIIDAPTVNGGKREGNQRAVKDLEAENSEKNELSGQLMLAEKLHNCTQLEHCLELINSTDLSLKLEENEMRLSDTGKGRVGFLDCYTPLENITHLINSLKLRVQDLQHEYEICAMEKTSANEENLSLRSLLSEKNGVADRLQSELASLKEVASEETIKLNEQLLAARQLTDEAVAFKDSLEAQLVEMKQSTELHQTEIEFKLSTLKETLSCQQNEISNLLEKNAKLQEQKHELEMNLQLSDEQTNESSVQKYGKGQLTDDVEGIKWEREMENLCDQLERQKLIVSTMEVDLESTKQTAEAERRRLEVERRTLKDQLRHQECSVKETQQELNESKAERVSLKESMSKLQIELNRAIEEMVEVQNQCSKLRQEKIELHHQLMALGGKAADLQQLACGKDNKRNSNSMFQSKGESTSAHVLVKPSQTKSLSFNEKSSADSGGICHLNHAPELTRSGLVASLSLATNNKQLNSYSLLQSTSVSVPPPKPPKPTACFRKRKSSVSSITKWFSKD